MKNTVIGKECLICDLLEVKSEQVEQVGKLPLAKPGIQRRTDEKELKAADDQAPMVQPPNSTLFSSQSNTETPSINTRAKVTTQTTTSTVPIPLVVTGGFAAGKVLKSNILSYHVHMKLSTRIFIIDISDIYL